MFEKDILSLIFRSKKDVDSFKLILIAILFILISYQQTNPNQQVNSKSEIKNSKTDKEKVNDKGLFNDVNKESVEQKDNYDDLTITYNGEDLREIDKPISKVISLKSKENMAEIIKEMYQGVNIEVSLVNGISVAGEVVGSFKGVLMLKSKGIMHYINDEFIVSFF